MVGMAVATMVASTAAMNIAIMQASVTARRRVTRPVVGEMADNGDSTDGVSYTALATEATMSGAVSLIMLQFLAWVADRPRSYVQTMEAWHSTCPRLSVWEDAIIDGLVRLENGPDRAVRLTPRGRAALRRATPADA